MAVTYRITKGSELTYQEMDDNLRHFLDVFEAKTANFTAAHGKTYLVTPPSSTLVTATLPSPGAGRIAFRLEVAESDRYLLIDPDIEAIEGETVGDLMKVDFAGEIVVLDWDGSVWRVR